MPTLEEIIHAKENVAEAEDFLADSLGLSQKERQILKENPLEVMVTGEEEGVAASYNFGTEGNRSRNFIRLSKDAVYNALAVGEEVAHSIRLRLNKATRDYFLNPLNRVKEKAKEYIQRINLEEYFGRLGALWYAEHKGQKQYASLWSRLKGYTIELIKKPIEFLTHYFGYKKAEEDFKTKDIKKFRKSLYDNDPKKMSIEPEYRMAA